MDSIPAGSSQKEISIRRRTLIDFYKSCDSDDNQMKFEHLVTKVQEATHSETCLKRPVKQVLSRIINQYKIKWQDVRRNNIQFQRKYKDWLDGYIHFPVQEQLRKSVESGRPSKNFEESSDRSKRRKTEELRATVETTELTYAAQMKFRAEGNIQAAKILKDITNTTSESAASHMKKDVQSPVTELSEDKALSLLVEAKLTKFQYNLIRNTALEGNCKLYPNYERVTIAKKRCYPENIVITESTAEIPLQNLLDHTMQRLGSTLTDVLSGLEASKLKTVWLISKWGCDGTSGQAEYKQFFENEDVSDASIFVSSLVPVQLVSGNPHGKHELIWQNPRPSSPRYCRPIRLQFVHETTQILKTETSDIENQINNLTSTEILICGKKISINHHLIMTMIDGKAMNAVTDTTSTQRCNLCGATSKDFNKIKYCLNRTIIDENRLQLGMSTLHCWIRFYEWLLNLSYKLKLCKWQARGSEDKAKIEFEKKRIQQEFKSKLGLLVDKPKHGYGSTNDGNSARRFFQIVKPPQKSLE